MSSRQGELAALLAAHSPADDEEARDLETMRVYAVTLGDRFSRDEPVAHFTGSAVVVDGEGAPAVTAIALARARAYARGWFIVWPGDGDAERTALRSPHGAR